MSVYISPNLPILYIKYTQLFLCQLCLDQVILKKTLENTNVMYSVTKKIFLKYLDNIIGN